MNFRQLLIVGLSILALGVGYLSYSASAITFNQCTSTDYMMMELVSHAAADRCKMDTLKFLASFCVLAAGMVGLLITLATSKPRPI